MLPKPDADHTSWANYCPLSLLNLDIKILAKVLTACLNAVVGSLVERDQVGVMPKRQAADSIQRATLLIHAPQKRKIPAYLLSLDIRKAFDTVSWDYLFYILDHWGFGPGFRARHCTRNPRRM